jgi:hypothetical protein
LPNDLRQEARTALAFPLSGWETPGHQPCGLRLAWLFAVIYRARQALRQQPPASARPQSGALQPAKASTHARSGSSHLLLLRAGALKKTLISRQQPFAGRRSGVLLLIASFPVEVNRAHRCMKLRVDFPLDSQRLYRYDTVRFENIPRES